MPSHTRFLLAGGAVALALLGLPQIALAGPGKGPDLVQRNGRFVILHADQRDAGTTRQSTLASGLRETPVRLPGDVWIDPGARVRLEGTMQNGTLVVADSLTGVQQLAPSPNSVRTSAVPSIETTAVVMFTFQGQTASALPSVATVQATMLTNANSLRAYYLEQTYGDIEFQADVLPPVQLAEPPPSNGDCIPSIFDWAQEAVSLEPGSFDPSLYKHVVYVFPQLPTAICGWSGLSEVGGTHAWINGSFTVNVLAHELGHNLGLAHAGGLSCTAAGAPAPVGDSCAIDRQHYALPQYADPFDAMGNAPVLRQMNMEHKLALGVLPDAAVQTAGASGTYQLAPMETLGPSVELLIVPKPGGGNYYVEYRVPSGIFDTAAGPSPAGVLVHTESPDLADPTSPVYADSDTALVDMHPDGAFATGQWQNAAMSLGQVFSDPANGIHIQDLSKDGAGATIAVSVPVDTTAPGSPGKLVAVPSGTSVDLLWTAATDDFGIASYRISRDGSGIGVATQTAFSDTGLAPGTIVSYAVAAIDTSGNVGAPPAAPATVRAVVRRDGDVRVSWAAAADNVGVTSYRVLRSGTGIAQANILSFVDTAPRAGAGATVTYSVVAFDAVGNASPPALAPAVRAALLRRLGAANLKVTRPKPGRFVRVQGTLSDARAVCRARLGRGAWQACRVAPSGAFSVGLRRTGARQVTLALRDEIGRVRVQILPAP
jgi:hypothetical protein